MTHHTPPHQCPRWPLFLSQCHLCPSHLGSITQPLRLVCLPSAPRERPIPHLPSHPNLSAPNTTNGSLPGQADPRALLQVTNCGPYPSFLTSLRLFPQLQTQYKSAMPSFCGHFKEKMQPKYIIHKHFTCSKCDYRPETFTWVNTDIS